LISPIFCRGPLRISLERAHAMGPAVIRRRHVLYVEGYDPQGAEGYYRLFRREWKRFLSLRPIEAKLGELSLESDDIAHWTIDAAGPTWRATTRYEFLRQERLIRANMAQPMLRQLGAEGNDRVFGPVGLDLGADGPEQIALSVVAELLSVLSRRKPGHLREREGVVHAG